MSEKQVIFRNGKAYLEIEERVPCLFVRDVNDIIPLDKEFSNPEVKKLLAKLIEEKDCEDSEKWVYRLFNHAMRDRRDGDFETDEDFLNESIGYKNQKTVEELDSLLTVLNTPIQLEEGTKFSHIWNYIEKDYEVFNVLFTDSLGGFDLQLWIDHAKIPHEKGTWELECEKGGYGMKELCCYWNYTIDQNEYSPFKGEFGGNGTHLWEGEIQETSYGVSFTPINAMMDYPLVLDEIIKITNVEEWNGKKINWINLEPQINTKKYWTPYTMIEAILWEISFMGSPQAQDEKHDQIKERMEGIKSGEIKTRPFKEILDELKDDEKDEEQERDNER